MHDQARLAVAGEQERNETLLTRRVRQRFDQGISAERELNRALAELEGVRASMAPLRARIEAQLNRIDVLLGEQPGTDRALLASSAPVPVAPDPSGSAAPADLLRRRPDVVAAERRLAASDARIGVAVPDHHPPVALQPARCGEPWRQQSIHRRRRPGVRRRGAKDDPLSDAVAYMFQDRYAAFFADIDTVEPGEALRQFVDIHPSMRHRDARAKGCPVPILAGDLHLLPIAAQERFGEAVDRLIGAVNTLLGRAGVVDAAGARSAVAEMVGAVALARTFADVSKAEALMMDVRRSVLAKFDLAEIDPESGIQAS